MCRKLNLIVLVVIPGLMLAMTGSMLAACALPLSFTFELKVDFCFNSGGEPDPATWKGSDPGFEDWIPLATYPDSEPHEALNVYNVGGIGINVGIAGAVFGAHTTFNKSLGCGEKICNSWITSDENAGDPQSNIHLVMWSTPDGLVPASYTIYGYHNIPDSSEPDMPVAEAMAYCEANVEQIYHRTHIDNIGAPYRPDQGVSCDGVISYASDYNVPIQHECLDNNLETSVVRFTTDGNPVWIMYHAGPASRSVLNAFILRVRHIDKRTSNPNPFYHFDVCPDTMLTWRNGPYGVENDVYLGTDFNDVNDATTSSGVYIGRQEAEEYDPPGLLEFGTTYYWRVDAVNDANVESPWKGRVWNFTTETGQATGPYPPDNSFSIDIYPVFTWSASCLANTHDVYFGDNLDDVNNATTSTAGIFKGNQAGTMYLLSGLLDNAKQYYWRIDEHTDTGVIKGNLWRFFTYGGTLFHYTFDGELGQVIHDPCEEYFVTDITGNVRFQKRGNLNALIYSESNPLVNPTGTSAYFQGDVGLYRGEDPNGRDPVQGIDITDLITPEYTIEMWIKVYSWDNEEMGLFRKWDRSYGLEISDDSFVHFWQAGSDPISSDANNPIQLNLWYHIAAVFDSEDALEPQKLYIDGDLVAAGGTTSINPDNDDDPATIGCSINPLRIGFEELNDEFDGLIDELRIWDMGLSPGWIPIEPSILAWMPKPKNGEQEVKYDVILKWRPGDLADSHDVYFGTDYNNVNDADTTTPVIYKGNIGPNDYDHGQLDLETTYYWRIDEIVDANGHRWKGYTWTFTVANYITIDDMEGYDPLIELIYYYWENLLYTGAYFELGTSPWQPVNNGVRSMQYYYDSSGEYYAYLYYSEAVLYLDSPQDWESTGVKMLTLYFYGDPNNDANDSEQMYVGLADGDSETFIDYDGDMNDIKVSDWQEWNIPLSDFTNVSMSGVEKVYIGFGDSGAVSPGGEGIVYFDDIRLYRSRCVCVCWMPDFDDDCMVGLGDLKILVNSWLEENPDIEMSGDTIINGADFSVFASYWMDDHHWP